MKRGTPRHPKVGRLCEQLGINVPTAVGILELLWHFTAEFAPQGDIGKYDDNRIEAGLLSWFRPKGKLILALIQAGWIDQDEVSRLIVHDWCDHADASVRKRLERAGLQFVSVAPKVTGQRMPTLPDGGNPPDPIQSRSNPVPEPVPEPKAIDPLRFAQNPREDGGLPGLVPPTQGDKPNRKTESNPCSDELHETLSLWRKIDWTAENVARVRAQLITAPAKTFAAHLDQMPRRFQPGGEDEAREVGFFVSTARNFEGQFSKAGDSNGLPKSRFDDMTEALGG